MKHSKPSPQPSPQGGREPSTRKVLPPCGEDLGRGLIFDIKRFAINDGPGIRTTLFMKGCPLRCVWCHNPEGLESQPVKLYTQKKCIGCQTCVEVCPTHNLLLTPDGIVEQGTCLLNSLEFPPHRGGGAGRGSCGRCTEECPTLALEMAGKNWTMDALMEVVEKERQVMTESGGGVTLCGGEPLMHPDYLAQVLTELGRRGIHRTVDTTLYASPETIERIMPLCELFLVDLKHMDSTLHQRYTRVPNEPILANIRRVSEAGHPYWIRIPLIVGVNADDDNLHASGRFLASLPTPPEVVNLLIYHDIGKGKHARLGTTYNPDNISMTPPSPEQQQHALEILAQYGITAKIGG